MDEEEVDGQVSSLKKSASVSSEVADGLGIEHGTFKWNEVEEVKDQDKDKDKNAGSKKIGSDANSSSNGASSRNGSSSINGDDDNETATAVDSASAVEPNDRRFELTDISVMFPEGELTVITGPTASGKTALLVRHSSTCSR